MREKYKKAPVDVDEILINPGAEKKKRVASFLAQVKNPYLMKIDGVIVEMEYNRNGQTMQEAAELAIGMDKSF